MKRILAASAAGLMALALGGAALANCATCSQRCFDSFPGERDKRQACMTGCALACVGIGI